MKNNLFILLLMLSAQQAFAQTCKDNIPVSTPDSRFTVIGSEVTDSETGLIWQRCSVGQTGSDCLGGSASTHTWQQALQQANGTWRLPNINELNSIVEERCYEPAINLAVFPNTVSGDYWSASTYAGDSGSAWILLFSYGHDFTGNKDYGHYVRLVRGGQ